MSRSDAAVVRFFYCGRGDTILVDASKGGCGLIDCNLTAASRADGRLRELLDKRGIGILDFVCLTHPDQDHYFGMKDLLEERFCDHDRNGLRPRFKQFWDSGADFRAIQAIADRMPGRKQKAAADTFRKLNAFLCPLFARGSVKRIALSELTIPNESFGDFFFVALGPLRKRVDLFTGQKYREILQSTDEQLRGPREQSNNLSTVLVMMHRTQPLNILFGGDATTEVWEEALAAWKRLHDLPGFTSRHQFFSGVKVSHHGARDSLHKKLYQDYCKNEVTLAILSVGPGDNNHPHAEVINMLRAQRIRAYATCWRTKDESGMAPGSEPASFDGLPLPGEPVGASAADAARPGVPRPAGDSDPYPLLPGHSCSDIEIKVYGDGRLEVTPAESLLAFG